MIDVSVKFVLGTSNHFINIEKVTLLQMLVKHQYFQKMLNMHLKFDCSAL